VKRHILFLMLLLFGVNELTAQIRVALLIGNNRYKLQDSLKNPLNDVRLLEQKLKDCGFEVIRKENLGRKDMINSVNEFYEKIKSAPSVALFYYSGHGIQSDGENFLIPVDADIHSKSDIESESFALGRLMGKMDESQSITNIIILDACRNDPYSKGWYRGEGEKGLVEIRKKPRQSFIAFATSPYDIANDGIGKNSPYSEAIAKYITEPGVSIFGVFQKVAYEVNKKYPKQIPWFNSSLFGDFYFKQGGGDAQKGSTADGRVEIKFITTADCFIYINGDSVGVVKSGAFFSTRVFPGSYRIKAISTQYPKLSWEETFSYSTGSNQEENLQLIPMHTRIAEFTGKQSQIPNGEENAEAKALRSLLDGIKYNMVFVDSGDFEMGTSGGENDESPVHKVRISSFYMSKYEVTQAQWEAIMGTDPSANKGCKTCPVENVSWEDANKFIQKLNQLTGGTYRMPTEAEWEYASRGGKLRINNKFSGGVKIDKYGWSYENSGGKSHPVGRLGGNELGIFDMSGNVGEWCSDWYDNNYYKNSVSFNPIGPANARSKVVRGGSWDDYDKTARVFARSKFEPATKNKSIGFRLAANAIEMQ
jgi:formylglycine-generating enzyme required for sulfatase activity